MVEKFDMNVGFQGESFMKPQNLSIKRFAD